MYLLSLSLEGVGGERVGRQKIERELAAARRPRGDSVQQLATEARQMGDECVRSIVYGAAQPLLQRLWRYRAPRVEPGQDLSASHSSSPRSPSRALPTSHSREFCSGQECCPTQSVDARRLVRQCSSKSRSESREPSPEEAMRRG